MLEKQVQDIYIKYKEQLLKSLSADAFYAAFVNMIRAGTRTYTHHNVFVERSIDEEWINRIDMTIPYLSRIINNPRQFLKAFEEVVPVELAKKTNSNTIKHLSSHTNFIRSVEDDDTVIPSKLLTTYNDDTLDIYENRFIATLVKKACEFVEVRYIKLLANMGGEKTSEFKMTGRFAQPGESTTYDMKILVEQDSKYMADHNLYRLLFERVQKVRDYLNAFNDTPFMRALKNLPSVRSPINKTNLLTKSPDYMACYELWEFLEQYTKPGYKINIMDTNPVPDEQTVSEAEAVALFYYLLLKNNMPGSRDAKEVEFKSQQSVEPQVIRKYGTSYKEKIDIGREDEGDDGTMAEIVFGVNNDSNVSHSLIFSNEKKDSVSFKLPPEADMVPEEKNLKISATGDTLDMRQRRIIPKKFFGLSGDDDEARQELIRSGMYEEDDVTEEEFRLLNKKKSTLNQRLEKPVDLDSRRSTSIKQPVPPLLSPTERRALEALEDKHAPAKKVIKEPSRKTAATKSSSQTRTSTSARTTKSSSAVRSNSGGSSVKSSGNTVRSGLERNTGSNSRGGAAVNSGAQRNTTTRTTTTTTRNTAQRSSEPVRKTTTERTTAAAHNAKPAPARNERTTTISNERNPRYVTNKTVIEPREQPVSQPVKKTVTRTTTRRVIRR